MNNNNENENIMYSFVVPPYKHVNTTKFREWEEIDSWWYRHFFKNIF
jgi:hypothetical protein